MISEHVIIRRGTLAPRTDDSPLGLEARALQTPLLLDLGNGGLVVDNVVVVVDRLALLSGDNLED